MKFSDRVDHFIPLQFPSVFLGLDFDYAATMSDECTLPAELIRPILQHIEDPEPLASLCLSSKLFQSEAQRTLYHFPTNFKLRPTQHIGLLTSLVHNSLLASLVKTYHVPSIMGSQKAAAWTLLRSVLPMMNNLKEFSIIAFSEDIKVLPMIESFASWRL